MKKLLIILLLPAILLLAGCEAPTEEFKCTYKKIHHFKGKYAEMYDFFLIDKKDMESKGFECDMPRVFEGRKYIMCCTRPLPTTKSN